MSVSLKVGPNVIILLLFVLYALSCHVTLKQIKLVCLIWADFPIFNFSMGDEIILPLKLDQYWRSSGKKVSKLGPNVIIPS
jgi:hypothetical protein